MQHIPSGSSLLSFWDRLKTYCASSGVALLNFLCSMYVVTVVIFGYFNSLRRYFLVCMLCRSCMQRRVRTRRRMIVRRETSTLVRLLACCSTRDMTSYRFTTVRRPTVRRVIRQSGTCYTRRRHSSVAVSCPRSC